MNSGSIRYGWETTGRDYLIQMVEDIRLVLELKLRMTNVTNHGFNLHLTHGIFENPIKMHVYKEIKIPLKCLESISEYLIGVF